MIAVRKLDCTLDEEERNSVEEEYIYIFFKIVSYLWLKIIVLK